jgi:hypothetical protein
VLALIRDKKKIANDMELLALKMNAIESKIAEEGVSLSRKFFELERQRDEPKCEVACTASVAPCADIAEILSSNTIAILGAVESLNSKVILRVEAAEARVQTLEDGRSLMAGAAVFPRCPSPFVKTCRFHPGCKKGDDCRFLHADVVHALHQSHSEAAGEDDPGLLDKLELSRCVGCGFFPWDGCASHCPVLVASTVPDESIGLGDGIAVTLGGIQSRPELNGTTGIITGYVKAKERWQVELDTTHVVKLFKASNLVVSNTWANSPPSEYC